jgi:hypoxanthine-guanine phosphoribosyltransferase
MHFMQINLPSLKEQEGIDINTTTDINISWDTGNISELEHTEDVLLIEDIGDDTNALRETNQTHQTRG